MEVDRLELRCIGRHETGYGKAFLRDGNSDAKPVGAKARVLNKEKGTRAALVMQSSVCTTVEVCGERHSYAVVGCAYWRLVTVKQAKLHA